MALNFVADKQDYSTIIEALTFQPGASSIDVKIPINNDDLFEGRETFFVYLTSGVDVSLPSNAQAEVVILDDGMMYSICSYTK